MLSTATLSDDVVEKWPASWTRVPLLLANCGLPLLNAAVGWRASGVAAQAVAHGLLAYALARSSCAWLGPVVTEFQTNHQELWLTLDDGPDGSHTRLLADELARRDVPATFFVRGDRLAGQLDVARELLASGHALGNHTQTHSPGTFWALPPRKLRTEIERCNDLIARAGGGQCRLFRAPAGIKHCLLHPVLDRLGMRLVGWTVRGFDGLGGDSASVVRRIVKKTRPGAVLLLHERRRFEGGVTSTECVLAAVDALRSRGFRFIVPALERLR